MALKGKEWFYKQCLKEVKNYSRLCTLCWDILEKGIGQSNKARGHVTQAIGACQEFLLAYPSHHSTIENTDPTLPFEIIRHTNIQSDLHKWLSSKSGGYGRNAFGYDYDRLKNILSPTLGGICQGGGGGDDEFKRVLRLMVHFMK